MIICVKIRPNKAERPGKIQLVLFREYEEELPLSLAMIYSKSLSGSKIPPDWKGVYVVPIHKKGDKPLAGDYRPVDLTSLVCKVLKSIIRAKWKFFF